MQLQNSIPATVSRLRARVSPGAIAADRFDHSLSPFERWCRRNVARDLSTAARIRCQSACWLRQAINSINLTLMSYRTGPLCFEEHTPSYTHTGGH